MTVFWVVSFAVAIAPDILAIRSDVGVRPFLIAHPVWLGVGGLLWLIAAALAVPRTVVRLRRVLTTIVTQVGIWRLGILGIVLAAAWIEVPSNGPVDKFRVVRRIAENAAGVVLLLALGLWIGHSPRLRGWIRRPDHVLRRMPLPWFLALATMCCIGASLFLRQFVVGAAPHFTDEATYLYQAQVFASGRIVNDAAPEGVPPIFRTRFVTPDPASYGAFPPGWPAVLAMGLRLGVPGLVNPLLAGACVVLTYFLLRRPAGDYGARCVSLLTAVCPFLLVMAAGLMAHVLALTAALGAAVAFRHCRRSWLVGVLGGLSLAVLFLTRPLDGALLAVFLAGMQLREGMRGSWSWRQLSLLLVSAVGPGLWFGFNARTTGSAAVVPMNAYFRQFEGVDDRLGFGVRGAVLHGRAKTHTPLGALTNLQNNLSSLDRNFLGWFGGSAVFLGLGFVSRGLRRFPAFLALFSLSFLLAYGFYRYHGGTDLFGSRFYLTLLPVLLLCVHRGLRALGRFLGVPPLGFAIVLLTYAYLVFMPVRAAQFHRASHIREAVAASLQLKQGESAIVLLPDNMGVGSAFLSVAWMNDLALSNPVLYGRDRGNADDLRAIQRVWLHRRVLHPTVPHLASRMSEDSH